MPGLKRGNGREAIRKRDKQGGRGGVGVLHLFIMCVLFCYKSTVGKHVVGCKDGVFKSGRRTTTSMKHVSLSYWRCD